MVVVTAAAVLVVVRFSAQVGRPTQCTGVTSLTLIRLSHDISSHVPVYTVLNLLGPDYRLKLMRLSHRPNHMEAGNVVPMAF